MEDRGDISVEIERPWHADLCQFFTRENVAELCLRHVKFPTNILTIRVLEPSAGHGAFFLPLLPRLVRACRAQQRSFSTLLPIIRAYEIDAHVANRLQLRTEAALATLGVDGSTARRIVHGWIRNEDFLESRPRSLFTHIVGNPPYIRWDAIPIALRESYKKRFELFKQRADLYVAFIERSLSLLDREGQLGFLCPGAWTRNVYGGSVRQALTSLGQIRTIIDLSDTSTFERTSDAYPHFFVFQKDRNGPTKICSVAGSKMIGQSGKTVFRTFLPSTSPLFLSRDLAAMDAVNAGTKLFPNIEDAGCSIRVGSATGCNEVFLGTRPELPVEPERLLPFVNASSIRKGEVCWSGAYIVNVFDAQGELVDLTKFPRLAAYLNGHANKLKARAKASKSRIWWCSIDNLQRDWYTAHKLLIVDVSAAPVIGIDQIGYCAGSGVYQIKSRDWPLADLHTFLSAGVLGLFVSVWSAGAANGFYRFQKNQIAKVHLPRWDHLDATWKDKFRAARAARDGGAILSLVAKQYGCDPRVLNKHVARDWRYIYSKPIEVMDA